MQTQADMGIGPVSCENCSVFKKGEGGPEAPGALRLRNKKATASVASSYSENPPVCASRFMKRMVNHRVPGKRGEQRMGIMEWWTHAGVPLRKAACNGSSMKCGIRYIMRTLAVLP